MPVLLNRNDRRGLRVRDHLGHHRDEGRQAEGRGVQQDPTASASSLGLVLAYPDEVPLHLRVQQADVVPGSAACLVSRRKDYCPDGLLVVDRDVDRL